MKARKIKKLYQVKKTLLDGWYFCMKPLATLILYIDKKRSIKKGDRLANMSLEEVAKLYVKYTVKYLSSRKDSTIKFYCCTKKEGCSELYEYNFILSDLNSVWYSRFTNNKLEGWRHYSHYCANIGYGDEGEKRWIELENNLRLLVEQEFIKVGCTVEHINEADKLDEWFMKNSGYVDTMVVSI